MTEEPFGKRLRRERERRHIALSSISANTKISASLFQALERDDVSRWPSGIFRRSFIRAYAEAIGLDADAITREFLERFPDPADHLSPFDGPPGAIGQRPVADRLSSERHAARSESGLRLTLADSGMPFAGGRVLAELSRRWIAVAWDLGTVFAIALLLFMALGVFWMPLAAAMLLYYAGGILVLGNSPGVCLFAPVPHDDKASRGEDSSAATPAEHASGVLQAWQMNDDPSRS